MSATSETTWNKGRVVGKKPPLTPDQVALIRLILRQERALRDLALFNVALDTSFRGSDLVRLRVSDVATPAGVREIVEIRQKKTEARNARPVQARLSSGTRDSLRASLPASEKPLHGWLFTGQGLGASNQFEMGAFIRSRAGVDYPDIQFHFLPIAVRYDGQAAAEGHGFQAHVGPMRSPSRR